jgi:hypothetical protein
MAADRRRETSAGSTDQRGVERDLGIEQLGDRTAGLGLGSEFLELRLVGAGHLGLQGQMDGGDGKIIGQFLDRAEAEIHTVRGVGYLLTEFDA